MPDNYPPTPPIRLPILGHAHYLFLHGPTKSTVIHELFRRYSKDGILTLHIGTWRFTIIGKHKMVRDIFSQEDTNFRRPQWVEVIRKARQSFTGTEGILFNEGQYWQEQQKFLLSTLRDFGVGRTNIEGLINNEVAHFCEHMERVLITQMGSLNEEDRPLNMFHIPVINVLWCIVAGERFDYEDPKLIDFVNKVAAMMKAPLFQPDASTFLPFLAKLLPNIDQPASYGPLPELKSFFNDTIKQHQDTFDSNNIRDFIDKYLLQIKVKGGEGSSFHESQGYEQLVNILLDLFIAGMDTTSNTLSFAILFMVNNQEVQLRVRQEIFDMVGMDRQVSLSDKAKIPYTEATVMEILRMADILPDGVPHMTKVSQRVGPYTIPEGHTIMPSLTAILKDDQEWTESDKFDPNRFLEDGKVKKLDSLIPFAAGKRQCPGESLAKAELFLFFTGLIQKFHFESIEKGGKIEIVAQSGVSRTPLPTNPIVVTEIKANQDF